MNRSYLCYAKGDTMKKLLALSAILIFTLTACTTPTSDTLPATPETTAPEESTTNRGRRDLLSDFCRQ